LEYFKIKRNEFYLLVDIAVDFLLIDATDFEWLSAFPHNFLLAGLSHFPSHHSCYKYFFLFKKAA